MEYSYKKHYKERSPIETVKEIQTILERIQLPVEEKWIEQSEINTFTVRIVIKGTNIGTNGKGVSKELARASGYGEFMERLENNLLYPRQWTDCEREVPDRKEWTINEYISQDSVYLDSYFKARGLQNASIEEKTQYFSEMEIVQHNYFGGNTVSVIPFFNARTRELEYLPMFVYPNYFGSNGMCAGNTKAEALVQGLSEIVERFVQKKCFMESLSLPDIPDKEIQKDPYIWERISAIRNLNDIEVYLKDASLGGRYPVVAMISIMKNSGKFGVKFGCHPIISIAMERTLTEATQGQKLRDFSLSSQLDFSNSEVLEGYNLENAMKVGVSQYPYQFLSKNPSFQYSCFPDWTKYSNEEILHIWTNELLKEGWDILIRDVSWLDFPAYQILVPGISETRSYQDKYIRVFNTKIYATFLLRNIDEINEQNLKYVIGAVEAHLFRINENYLSDFFHVKGDTQFPAVDIREETYYFCALACFQAKDYEKSLRYITHVVNKALEKKNSLLGYYIAMKYYISGMIEIKNHKEVLGYLEILFNETICNQIDIIFSDEDNIIQRVYGQFSNKDDEMDVEKGVIDRIKATIRGSSINQNDVLLKWDSTD